MIKRKPTILHAIDTTGPGGAETVFLDLVQNLNIEGFDNLAIIKGPGWVEDQLKARQITYYVVKPKGFLSLPYYWTLFRLLHQHNVKLIQAHLLGSTLTYSILSILLRIPLIATLHGQVDVNPNEKRVYLKNRIMRTGVNRLIAVSQGLASYIADRGLFHQKNIGVIYNGVDTARYGRNKLSAVREQLQLGDDAILVGSVGNIRPAKAYHTLIDAAAVLKQSYPNLHFVIAGHQKPALMEQLERQLQALKLHGRVHFIGFHGNTAEFLGQMDLFVLSSKSEGFSIATIEALATGLPALVTRCGGPEEIVEHGETGWMVSPDNSNAIAEGLEILLKDDRLRGRLGRSGKEHAKSTFSMTTLLSAYQNEYMRLLPKGSLTYTKPSERSTTGHP